jgi:hypothetical protein
MLASESASRAGSTWSNSEASGARSKHLTVVDDRRSTVSESSGVERFSMRTSHNGTCMLNRSSGESDSTISNTEYGSFPGRLMSVCTRRSPQLGCRQEIWGAQWPAWTDSCPDGFWGRGGACMCGSTGSKAVRTSFASVAPICCGEGVGGGAFRHWNPSSVSA